MLGLPGSAANAFAVWFLKRIRQSDSLVLAIFAGQRPQGGGTLLTPGDKIYKFALEKVTPGGTYSTRGGGILRHLR